MDNIKIPILDQDKEDEIRCKRLIDSGLIKIINYDDLAFDKGEDALLGEGGDSSVYKASIGSTLVAVKVLKKLDWRRLFHEILSQNIINHDCVIKFFGISLSKKGEPCIVMEYVNGKSLDCIDFDQVPFKVRFKLAKHICSTIQYLHSCNIIHRDLKFENILFSMDTLDIKIIDFGVAKVCEDSDSLATTTRIKGTINYMSPEMFQAFYVNDNGNYVNEVTDRFDVWSFGCILSYLFSGVEPWTNKFKNQELIRSALTSGVPFPIPDTITDPYLRRLIEICTIQNVRERPNIDKVMALILELETSLSK